MGSQRVGKDWATFTFFDIGVLMGFLQLNLLPGKEAALIISGSILHPTAASGGRRQLKRAGRIREINAPPAGIWGLLSLPEATYFSRLFSGSTQIFPTLPSNWLGRFRHPGTRRDQSKPGICSATLQIWHSRLRALGFAPPRPGSQFIHSRPVPTFHPAPSSRRCFSVCRSYCAQSLIVCKSQK